MTHTIASATIAQMTSANKARSFDGVSRTTGLKTPLALIKEEDGFNARMDSVENAEHIDRMARAFANGDTPETLEVVAVILEDGTNGFKLIDGHCTFKAVLRANEVYGASFKTLDLKVKEMTTLEQRFRVLTSNNQKKLNMIERGKMYNDIATLEGKTQTEIADRLQVSVAQVSNCIQAFNMPNEMKELVAQGILSDSEAFNKYRNEIKTSDIEETTANATAFAQEIKAYSETRVAKGEAKRVTTKIIESKGADQAEAPKTRFSREVKVDVANAMAEINTALEGIEEGQGATLTLTAEQVAILRKAGIHF